MATHPKGTKFHPLSSDDISDSELLSWEKTDTCCGVMEIGHFHIHRAGRPTMIKDFGLEVSSVEQVVSEGYWNSVYYDPKYRRLATYEEILKAFKELQEKQWISSAGMGVLWFRPEQQKGDWARLFKDLGWEDQGSFWNPNTRRTLHIWARVFRKGPPRKKKSSKSILTRSTR